MAHALIQGDCIEGMERLNAGSAHLVFADPPFNIGYDYDVYQDRQSDQGYLDWTERWGRAVSRVLKPNGTFWLAIGDDYAANLKILFEQRLGFSCRSWVIWYYTFGVNCTKKFSRSHTHLFHFVKNPRDFTFNADLIRVPSARQMVYADSRAFAKGRLPDDTWILRPQDLADGFEPCEDTWYFPRVCGTFKERAGFHGCQMPERLLERIIKVSSNPGELVLDPFAGSGSTLVVAKKLCRECLGFELSANYAKKIKHRLDATYEGEPLDGAPEPKVSAPSTNQGRSLEDTTQGRFLEDQNRRPSASSSKKTSVQAGIIEAFLVARDGFPVDRVIADPDLNREFVSVCQRFGLPGTALEWNSKLMNLRKSSQLKGMPRSKRTAIAEQERDRYSFACEIAIQCFHADNWKLDQLLCDPERAAEFDELVRGIVGRRLPSLVMRWIALSIRKRALDIRQRSRSVPRRVPLPKAPSLIEQLDLERVPAAAGLYWLSDIEQDRNLYIGETLNLKDRLHTQFFDTCFDFWGTKRSHLEIRLREFNPDRQRQGNQSIWIREWRPLGNYEKLAAL